MNNKEKYLKFCEQINVNIFVQPFWLDAVVGSENWDVIVNEKGGKILGVLPYSFEKTKKGMIIKEGKITQKSGIYINYPQNQKYTSKLSFERKVINSLIGELERKDIKSYSQNFDYSFTNWLPFYWKNYNQTTRYSYIIEDTSNYEEIYNEIDSTTKNVIRKAEKVVKVKKGMTVEEFYKINKMTFDRKNMEMPYDISTLKKIDKVCNDRNCREIFYAEDEKNNIHAAIYVVWDKESMYYLLGGINPDYKNSNSTSLLLLEAIKSACDMGIKFDFEGSMNKDIEKFFSSFGGIQKQYFTIAKDFKFDLRKSIITFVLGAPKLKNLIKKFIK
ncbi:GNAT family N-acetyltransferase [Clostridium nigeriense]|uniref:GNAT family N-acetyltransferase n=1 Tax=Clostridium nigeriense TaxID=1805470 RepID=UPI000834D002|nr:GNAT family N-acetyltransferase [Clostridium nigeriense]